MQNFADKLKQAIQRTAAPVVVGLDPRLDQLPPAIVKHHLDTLRLEDQAEACRVFCRGVIDVVAAHVPAVKPQAAFFEQLGPLGMAALADVIRHARKQGLLVILDAKRNDIGSTAAAYAQAYLTETGPWQADCLTVSPYLGDDSLTPFVEVLKDSGSGIFVLVKTSNPGGKMLQDLQVDGRLVYQVVAEHVEQLAQQTRGECGFGAVGAVVGATYPDQLAELRASMPGTWFLVPGYGAQGGGARDVAGGFTEDGLGAIVNNARGIIFAHSKEPYASQFEAIQWQQAVEAATLDMIDQLRSETPAGRLT